MYPFPGLAPRVSQEVFAQLCQALPPPLDDTDASRDSRDMMAMAAVAAFCPADITEALLAVEVVATEAHARDCLRQAGEYRDEIKVSLRCRAQAVSMMRQKYRALRTLHEYQAARPIPREEPADATLTPDLPAEQAAPALPVPAERDMAPASSAARQARPDQPPRDRDAEPPVGSSPDPLAQRRSPGPAGQRPATSKWRLAA